MIRLIDGVIKSLQTISRHLKGRNENAYRYCDNIIGMVETERKERADGCRPAIISEDTKPFIDNDVDCNYKGEKGPNSFRGSV